MGVDSRLVTDVGGKNFVFWFSRTQENASLDALSKDVDFVPQMFFLL